MFDFEEIDDFHKHITMSIPNYDGLCHVFKALVSEFAHPRGTVIDIGCSNGSFISACSKINDKIKCIGVDVVDIRDTNGFDFVKVDALVYLKNVEVADVIVSMFTLQFLGKHLRKDVIEEMRRLVQGGTTLLISEKCFFPSKIESVLKREHIQQKRKHFTSDEILDKDKNLFGSMYCTTLEEFVTELKYIGTPVPVWQSYNFKGFIVSQ